MTDYNKQVQIEVNKLAKRRVDTQPQREPGKGATITKTVSVYPETLNKMDGQSKDRERRRQESDARVSAWRMNSPEKQLAILNEHIPNGANRQKARLLKQIAEANEAAKKAVAKPAKQVEQNKVFVSQAEKRRFEMQQNQRNKNK